MCEFPFVFTNGTSCEKPISDNLDPFWLLFQCCCIIFLLLGVLPLVIGRLWSLRRHMKKRKAGLTESWQFPVYLSILLAILFSCAYFINPLGLRNLSFGLEIYVLSETLLQLIFCLCGVHLIDFFQMLSNRSLYRQSLTATMKLKICIGIAAILLLFLILSLSLQSYFYFINALKHFTLLGFYIVFLFRSLTLVNNVNNFLREQSIRQSSFTGGRSRSRSQSVNVLRGESEQTTVNNTVGVSTVANKVVQSQTSGKRRKSYESKYTRISSKRMKTPRRVSTTLKTRTSSAATAETVGSTEKDKEKDKMDSLEVPDEDFEVNITNLSSTEAAKRDYKSVRKHRKGSHLSETGRQRGISNLKELPVTTSVDEDKGDNKPKEVVKYTKIVGSAKNRSFLGRFAINTLKNLELAKVANTASSVLWQSADALHIKFFRIRLFVYYLCLISLLTILKVFLVDLKPHKSLQLSLRKGLENDFEDNKVEEYIFSIILVFLTFISTVLFGILGLKLFEVPAETKIKKNSSARIRISQENGIEQ